MQLRSESIPGIPRTRDTERSMINATTRKRRFETRLETRFETRLETRLETSLYSQGDIWNAFEPETRFCRDDKRKVVLKRLYNVSQKKEPWNNGQKVVGCVTIIIFISWSMINMLSNDT